MFRVYNIKKCKWENDIFIDAYNNIYKISKNLFDKIFLLHDKTDEYVFHKFIDLYDKNSEMVFEGDIIEAQVANDITVTGIVTYAKEYSSYVILCYNPDEFYVLGDSICQQIEVVGNVFDTPELLPKDIIGEYND